MKRKINDEENEIEEKTAEWWFRESFRQRGLKALECLDKAIDLDPMMAEAWFQKGLLLDDYGRNKEAQKCYDKAEEIDPKNCAPLA